MIFTLLVAVLLSLFLLFVTIPVASLFLRIAPEAIIRSLTEPVVLDALSLYLVTATISYVIVVIFGTPLALQTPGMTIRAGISSTP